MIRIFASKYVPQDQKNYHDLEWFERNFMTYIGYLKYEECVSNPDSYFDRTKVGNSDIVNNRSRSDCLVKPIKEHQTTFINDFVNFPEKDKDKIVLTALRKNRDDLWMKRDLMI